MKCEICHKNDAQTAIQIPDDSGSERELYVCHACARIERSRQSKNNSRTRQVKGLPPGVSMSITQVGGDFDEGVEPPPIVGAIMNAFQNMVNDIEKEKNSSKEKSSNATDSRKSVFPCSKLALPFRLRGGIHLEGLFLIGELEAVIRAAHALDIEFEAVCTTPNLDSAGHVYTVRYTGSSSVVRRFITDLLEQERNARLRLRGEDRIVFADAISRSLAILKSCRLLSSDELFDILSPLRLAAREHLLSGITASEIERIIAGLNLAIKEEEDRAIEDGELSDKLISRAQSMNIRFESVAMIEEAML